MQAPLESFPKKFILKHLNALDNTYDHNTHAYTARGFIPLLPCSHLFSQPRSLSQTKTKSNTLNECILCTNDRDEHVIHIYIYIHTYIHTIMTRETSGPHSRKQHRSTLHLPVAFAFAFALSIRFFTPTRHAQLSRHIALATKDPHNPPETT